MRKRKIKSNKIIAYGLFLAVASLTIIGCGRLWGGLYWYPRVSSSSQILGLVVGSVGRTTASTGTCTAPGAVSTWCTGGTFASGTADGMADFPVAVDVDGQNGFLYVGDNNNHRVVKLVLSTGAFVGAIGRSNASIGTCPVFSAAPGWCTGGTFATGTADGEFGTTPGVAVDPANDALYVADYFNNRVSKFVLSTGVFVGSIGNTTGTTGTCPAAGAAPGWCTGGTFGAGASDGMFGNAGLGRIAIDSVNGFLYITDSTNFRVVKVNASTGAFVGAIGRTTATAGTCPAAGAAPGWCTGGTFATGTGDGMYAGPSGVAIDKTNGFLYVSDSTSNRVSKVDLATGAFVGAIGRTTATTGSCPAAGAAPGWCTGGTFANGTSDGTFGMLFGATVDVLNRIIYITDTGNNRLTKIR